MAWAYQPFDIQCWDGHISLSDTHFNLQFVYNLICYVNDFLKNVYLLLITDNCYFGTF